MPRGTELLIILLIVLILFGARRLPALASSIGRSIKEFRRASDTHAEEERADGSDERA